MERSEMGRIECQQDSRREEEISWDKTVAIRRFLSWFPSIHVTLSGGWVRTGSYSRTKLQSQVPVTDRAEPQLSFLRLQHLGASSAPFPSLVQLSAHTCRVTASLTNSFNCYSLVRERKISWCSTFLPRPCLDPSHPPVLVVSSAPNNVCLLPWHLCVNWYRYQQAVSLA